MVQDRSAVRFDHYLVDRLYRPDTGFYELGGAGRSGNDFLTSPEVGPLFGEVIANAVLDAWRAAAQPNDFTICEVGAGRGTLARNVMRVLGEHSISMRYVAVERSRRLRALGRDAFASAGGSVEYRAELPDRPFVGMIVANELLDNLPPRLFERTHDGWQEIWVLHGEPVLADLGDAGPLQGVQAPVGTRLPWFESAATWVGHARSCVTGSVVAFDYGVRATEELVGRDWLRTYRGHSRGVFNFEQSFECDVTADVAFDQLPAPQSLSTQRDWLIQHGIDGLVEAGRRIWQERAHLGDLAAIRGRSRSVEADALCDMNGLGAFLVAEWSGEAKESAVP